MVKAVATTSWDKFWTSTIASLAAYSKGYLDLGIIFQNPSLGNVTEETYQFELKSLGKDLLVRSTIFITFLVK